MSARDWKFQPVAQPNSKDYGTQQTNMALERYRNELEQIPFLSAVIVDSYGGQDGVTFTAGQTLTIAHKLGKDWSGWWPIYRLPSTDYVSLKAVANPTGYTNATHFSVTAKGACTVDFLVF